MAKKEIKKAVLAYSGGLDTSIILKWLQDEYKCEVVTFTADLGQGEEVEPARQKALTMGIKPENIFILDLREEFVKDFVFPMFRANTIYEGEYLLGTSIARPLIAKKQIEIAAQTGADAVSHGATGKGNDQVRFELGYLGLNGDIAVIRFFVSNEFRDSGPATSQTNHLVTFAIGTNSNSPNRGIKTRYISPTSKDRNDTSNFFCICHKTIFRN